MTKRREWPNAAREARDRSAEEANRALLALRPLVDRPLSEFSRGEVIRRVAIALSAVGTIARFLEGEGAQTRPV